MGHDQSRRRRIGLVVAAAAVMTSSLGVVEAQAGQGLSEAQARARVAEYLEARAAVVAGKPMAREVTDLPLSAELRDRVRAEAEVMRAQRAAFAKSPSRGHISADVKVTVDAVTPRPSGRVEVRATEVTNLRFGHKNPEAPPYEGYRLRHTFVFASTGGRWVMETATPDHQPGPPPPTFPDMTPRSSANRVASPSDAPPHSSTQRGPVGQEPVQQTANAYDYQAMNVYASTYWDNYNPAFHEYGNDCTNFISQIMQAGGWYEEQGMPDPDPRNDPRAWYYRDPYFASSYSWAGAANFGEYARLSGRTRLLPSVDQLYVSDILQVDWDLPGEPDVDPAEPPNNIDHTMIVTHRVGNGEHAEEIYLAYHSSDQWGRPFFGFLLPYAPEGIWYARRT